MIGSFPPVAITVYTLNTQLQSAYTILSQINNWQNMGVIKSQDDSCKMMTTRLLLLRMGEMFIPVIQNNNQFARFKSQLIILCSFEVIQGPDLK